MRVPLMAKTRRLLAAIFCCIPMLGQAASLVASVVDLSSLQITHAAVVVPAHPLFERERILAPIFDATPSEPKITLPAAHSLGGAVALMLVEPKTSQVRLCEQGQDMRCWRLDGMNLECRLCTVQNIDDPWRPCRRSLMLRSGVQCERIE